MGNGLLIFIVIAEAVAIIWLASKLKHYQKFEYMLNAQADMPTASPAKAALFTATAPDTDKSSSVSDFDEVLDMPGVEPEMNIEEAKRVQLVMARCHYAEFYLEQLDDDYERGQFKHIINSCMNTATEISDPFFRASALHPLIVLLDKAGWEAKRDKMMAQVDDDIIRQRIERELAANADS